jgi:hypothetical protein
MFVKETAKPQHEDLSGHHWNDCQMVHSISSEDSSQELGASRGEPTDKRLGGY